MMRFTAVKCAASCALVALGLWAFGATRMAFAAPAAKEALAKAEKHEGAEKHEPALKVEVTDKPVESEKHDEHGKHGESESSGEPSLKHGVEKLEDHDLSHANATFALGSPTQVKSDLAIYTFIVFLILVAILWKFAWGPIMEGLTKREQNIANQIAEANQAAADAKALLAEHQAKLSSAAAEVRQLLEEGRREAEASSAKIVSEANAAAKRERDTALSQIDAAKNAALRELAQKSVDTAIGLASKIVSRQLTPQDHAQLVREAAAQLPSSN